MNHPKDIENEFITQIETHQGILHKICFVYANTNTDKDDLYQEIVLQLWKSYPSFQGKSKFSTWMYRVALNTAITMTKRPKFVFIDLENHTVAVSIEPAMDYSEDVKLLYKAISQLNKIEKAIVLLWLEEKSYVEISEAIGLTVSNVSVKLTRLKAKLAQLIERLQ